MTTSAVPNRPRTPTLQTDCKPTAEELAHLRIGRAIKALLDLLIMTEEAIDLWFQAPDAAGADRIETILGLRQDFVRIIVEASPHASADVRRALTDKGIIEAGI